MAMIMGKRVLVTGLPGSGKTTLAKALSARDGRPHVEVDRLYYGPGWHPRPTFLADLERALEPAAWYLDDVGHEACRDLTWDRADTLVWLDLPWTLSARRAIARTWRSLRTKQEYLPGCRETWIGWGHAKHPVRLSVLSNRPLRREVVERLQDPRWQHLEVVHLRSREQVAAFLAGD